MQVQAIRFATTGSADVLFSDTIELAQPRGLQVLVRHQAIGVNFIDTYHRSGLYPLDLPPTQGRMANPGEYITASVSTTTTIETQCKEKTSLPEPSGKTSSVIRGP